jgi:hypothetical protein
MIGFIRQVSEKRRNGGNNVDDLGLSLDGSLYLKMELRRCEVVLENM